MKLSNILIYTFAFSQCSSTILPQRIFQLSPSTTSYSHSLFDDLISYFYPSSTQQDDFEAWLVQEKIISFEGIFNNIGGLSKILDPTIVEKGVVIASPSTSYPNYFYQWIRDLAITIKTLLCHLNDMTQDEFEQQGQLLDVIESFIENNYQLQRLDNLSGTFADKSGLGEPKFNVDNTVFNESWGRPQRDGPGLRSSTIMYYLKLIDKFNAPIQSQILKNQKFIYFKVIRPDLMYIVQNWQKPGFDLWEEINSIHFFTSITQLKAIKDGIEFAAKYKDYELQDQLITAFQQLKLAIESQQQFGFTSSVISHIIECPNLYKIGHRSGLDAATLLGSIHSHDDYQSDSSMIPFDIDNPYVINTLVAMVNDMKFRYPINHNKIGLLGVGVGIGRYPEDIYDGVHTSEGNPWFISTATALELVYRLIHKYITLRQDIVITAANRGFFSQFISIDEEPNDGNAVVIEFNSVMYRTLMLQLALYADSFLSVIKTHVDGEGRMSEQFNKYTGYMQGAKELTWSYSAFWNAVRWRERTLQVM